MGEPRSSRFLTADRALLIAIILVGIIGSGVAAWAFGRAGYSDIGQVVFVIGYGGMVFAIWYGWIRPLDIRGPEE
ncbi:hypothetical protein ACNS7O_03585 [Haloferacaceae archaeon DSL9]